jgi:spermidine/putrescine transport system permease protein
VEQHWQRAKAAFAAIALPPVLWLIAFFVIPLGIIGAYSFGENADLVHIAVTGTLRNYGKVLEPLYLGIFIKSAWIAALTTFLCLIIAFPVALAITFASSRLKLILLMMIMLPFWTNLLIRTYALMAVLRTEGYANLTLAALWKFLSGLMVAIGFGAPPAYQPLELLYNGGAVIFGLVYVQLPFMVLPLYAALDRMDRSLIEASLDLGAGHLRTLWSIVIPLAMPGIVSGVIITFIPSVGAYLTPDLLGGPDSQMIANVIERQFKRANNWPLGAALSFMLLYMTFIAIALQGLLARRGRRA